MSPAGTTLIPVVAAVLTAVSPVRGQPDSPCYEGFIGSAGSLRRVIVEQSGEAATVHVYSRPPRAVGLKRADAAGDSLYASVHMVSADGLTTLTMSGTSGTLTLARAAGPATAVVRAMGPPQAGKSDEGVWHTSIGPGGVIRVVARLQGGPCGHLVGQLDSPDQGQQNLPMTSVGVMGDSLVMEAAYMDLRIALARGSSVERAGTLVQNGITHEILMHRGAEAPTLRRPQEPVRPYPYDEREVRFASRAPGVRLAGTLTLPRSHGRHPGVVLISGSGAQDRDETIAGHKPFLVLSDWLTRNGYAVLRVDDRGTGGSTGNVRTSTLMDIADDVRGAVDYLRGTAEIDTAAIGLIGHSEGGYVAPVVAAGDRSVAFVALLGAPSVGGRAVFAAQRSALARASGATPRTIRVDSVLNARVFSVLDARPADDSLAHAVDRVLGAWLRSLSGADRATADSLLRGRTPAQDSASVEFWKSAWFRSVYFHDPATFLRRVDVPLLAVLGDLDLQVPAVQSAPAFNRLFRGERRRLLTLQLVPGVNHMLQTATRGTMDEYMLIEETIAPTVLRHITDWLSRVAPAAPNQGVPTPAEKERA
ncbi:MAG TPA: alpha/beta hydrolase [Longimicrobium sp.]